MRQGRIIRGVSSFYDVLLEDGGIVTCKARGRFRNEGLTPMVGDLAALSDASAGSPVIDEILPRKNALVRPPVANIDQLIIVTAASVPKPDWLLLDKLILQAMLLGVRPLLVLNKLDERSEEIVSAFLEDYADHFDTLCVSSHTGEGMEALRTRLPGRISCFSGQSAVGKSSLLNALIPALSLEVGGLAKKTDRGRHTTRRAELWPFEGGAVLDTPGFSLFELDTVTQEALDACYPEFGNAPERCRFAGCRHISEPGCAVKDVLALHGMSERRYARYAALSEEIEQRRKHQYD